MSEEILREALKIVSWGAEETAESNEARKYANVLEGVELQIKYWENEEQKAVRKQK